jgi:hypothetical protein
MGSVQSGGLGHDYGISRVDIEKAAALHYNGVMKPWLDLGHMIIRATGGST